MATITTQQDRIKLLGSLAITSFLVGVLPLLALTFFSPGLDSETKWGGLIFIFGIVTYVLLLLAAMKSKPLWLLVVIQTLLLVGVLIETFSDATLYIGT